MARTRKIGETPDEVCDGVCDDIRRILEQEQEQAVAERTCPTCNSATELQGSRRVCSTYPKCLWWEFITDPQPDPEMVKAAHEAYERGDTLTHEEALAEIQARKEVFCEDSCDVCEGDPSSGS